MARKLAKHGLEYRTERVPYSRKDRPEIVELTRQSRVPVLIDGDEVIHDSKRIRQYLDWKPRNAVERQIDVGREQIRAGSLGRETTAGCHAGETRRKR